MQLPTNSVASLARRTVFLSGLGILVGACASSESHRTIQPEVPLAAQVDYEGPTFPVSVGRFDNASPYLRGIFTPDGPDRLGGQARTLLETSLASVGRFDVLDRENLRALEAEAGYAGESLAIEGADVLITGQVTEFGRKRTGDKQLFGILGKGKEQAAYARVSMNVVDARTARVLFSVEGAGEYRLNDREILGTGTTSGYDETLNGKVLSLAIREAVDRLVERVDGGALQDLGAGQ